ncbi:MAG TPA: hypothetical protein VF278_00925, partial [Pirellulales bacterium]
MTHLLDTNSCVNHLRLGQASNVTGKLAAAAPGSVALCSIVLAELLWPAQKNEFHSGNHQRFDARFVPLRHHRLHAGGAMI